MQKISNHSNGKEGKEGKKKKQPYQKISKTLTSILRHNAVSLGLEINAAGFIKLDDILAHLKVKGFKNVNQNIIRNIVDNNNKKRFELQQINQKLCIRATQGHSMKQVQTQQLLTKITDPTLYPSVIHGTYTKFWIYIKNQGLKRMGRNHIHFAPGMPKQHGVISVIRSSCDIYIEIDMLAAIKDGINFYISSNNVILTQGIDGVLPPKYFKKVTTRQGQNLLKNQQKIQQKQQIEKKQKNK